MLMHTTMFHACSSAKFSMQYFHPDFGQGFFVSTM
jgi:hypothetical protein